MIHILGQKVPYTKEELDLQERFISENRFMLATEHRDLIKYYEPTIDGLPYDTEAKLKLTKAANLIYTGFFDGARELLDTFDAKAILHKRHQYIEYMLYQYSYNLDLAVMLAEEKHLRKARPYFLAALLYELGYLYSVTEEIGDAFTALFCEKSIVYDDIVEYYPETTDEDFFDRIVEIVKVGPMFLGQEIFTYLLQNGNQIPARMYASDCYIMWKSAKELSNEEYMKEEQNSLKEIMADPNLVTDAFREGYIQNFYAFFDSELASIEEKVQEYKDKLADE